MNKLNGTARAVRVALIGAGRMGSNHLRILSEDPRFELVAVVDPRPAPAVAPHILSGVQLLSEVRELDLRAIDAAIVATPGHLHAPVAEHLLTGGIPTLMEKPLCPSYCEARRIALLARACQVPLVVGHVERFNPAITRVRQVLSAGVIGTPIHYSFTRVGGYPGDVVGKGNVLMDLAVHDLDILRLMAGNIRIKSYVTHSTVAPEYLDTAELLLTTSAGASASIHVNWITPTKIRQLRITGTKGVAFVDYMLQTCTVYGGGLLEQEKPQHDFEALVARYSNPDRVEFGVIKAEPLKLQLDNFWRLLQGREHGCCPAAVAARTVLLAEQMLNVAG